MKKLTKTLTALLLAGTTLSFMCGCDNGAADDKNSSAGGNSATQSTVSDKNDTSSKDENKTDETSSKDDSKPDEASDPDYEKMMEAVNKIKTAPDRKNISDKDNIIKLLGKPDSDITGSTFSFIQYKFGKYTLQISWSSDTGTNKIIVATWNSETVKGLFAFEIDIASGEFSSTPIIEE